MLTPGGYSPARADRLVPLSAVRSGQVGLLEIVRALGDYLTSTEDEVRVKGETIWYRFDMHSLEIGGLTQIGPSNQG